MSSTVERAYGDLVAAGQLSQERAQVAVARALDDVLHDLAAEPSGIGAFFRRRRSRRNAAKGLYVWGAVGRGKTMLMDLFFDAVPLDAKRRVHFNDFMIDVHRRLAERRAARADDAVGDVADAIAAEAAVLCFDEFAVSDIADAMILSRLFDRIFERGTTLIATSNVAPQELYEGGLNRALFVPFIRLLLDHVDVVRLDTPTDFRLDRLSDRRVWFAPGDAGFERLWDGLVGDRGDAPAAVTVGSRTVTVPRAAGSLARFTFAELVGQAMGAADFLAIAQRFHTLFLEGIPVIAGSQRDTARRFILLIDVLYDQKVRLVASAAGEPRDLFRPAEDEARAEAFAFERTASRLYEMRSSGYLEDIETAPLT